MLFIDNKILFSSTLVILGPLDKVGVFKSSSTGFSKSIGKTVFWKTSDDSDVFKKSIRHTSYSRNVSDIGDIQTFAKPLTQADW
jgi:hypothetical protein